MKKISLIIQGIPANQHIEAALVRAFQSTKEYQLTLVSLPAYYNFQKKNSPTATHPELLAACMPKLYSELIACDASHVLFLNGHIFERYSPGFLRKLRDSGKQLIGWQIDDPYYVDEGIKFISCLNTVLTVDSSVLAMYKGYSSNAHFLPLAFDPELHRPMPTVESQEFLYDVSFIGTPFKGSRRVRLFDSLANSLSDKRVFLGGASALDSWGKNLTNVLDYKNNLHDRWIDNSEAVRIFSKSMININIHKDNSGHVWDRNISNISANSPCERTFVLAGCGAFQLIDDGRPDLSKFFELGGEIVTFRDEVDLKDKIAYFLKNESERKEIADSAYKRAIADHSYACRLEKIIEFSGL